MRERRIALTRFAGTRLFRIFKILQRHNPAHVWGGHSCPPPLILTRFTTQSHCKTTRPQPPGHNIVVAKKTTSTAGGQEYPPPHNLLAECSIGRAGLECRRVSFGDAAVFALPNFHDARRHNRRAISRMPEFQMHAPAHKTYLQHGTAP